MSQSPGFAGMLEGAVAKPVDRLTTGKESLMRSKMLQKVITATLTVAATAAFSVGTSSEAWGGKSSAWDHVGTITTSSSAWDLARTTTRTSEWD